MSSIYSFRESFIANQLCFTWLLCLVNNHSLLQYQEALRPDTAVARVWSAHLDAKFSMYSGFYSCLSWRVKSFLLQILKCTCLQLHVHDAVSLQGFVSSLPQSPVGKTCPGVFAVDTETVRLRLDISLDNTALEISKVTFLSIIITFYY